ncbi:MAG: heme-binding domain-containing protein [Bacteroidota bacterium]|nr:heme-binding domain-containing protein [Bacteroidota bacterium]MDP4251450.1 heme-binding domain-containing protein [Bacteroidota bacterium]
MIRKILIVFLILFLALQFIRPARNTGVASSGSDITHYVHVPDTVMHILITSCYDCHSNHTEYPWYTNISPIGLWMRQHINHGKKAINFSDLSSFTKKKLDHRFGDIAEQVEKDEMPLPSYTFIHTYAKLDSGQVKLIKSWTDSARRELAFPKEIPGREAQKGASVPLGG